MCLFREMAWGFSYIGKQRLNNELLSGQVRDLSMSSVQSWVCVRGEAHGNLASASGRGRTLP